MGVATTTDTVTLRKETPDGDVLEVTFAPAQGMNLMSYKRNGIEVIDQSTRPLFDERFAGLGALIGPHFHRRNEKTLPSFEGEDRFPHIAKVKAKGVKDPFSHGIARYAPWTFEASDTAISATLTGKDEWNEVPLAKLEGQNFNISYRARLGDDSLKLTLSIVGDTDSLMGLHFYYRLPNGQGTVTSDVRKTYLDQGKTKEIPADWNYDENRHLTWDLKNEADYGFQSHSNPLGGSILLTTSEYKLETEFYTGNEENSWQLFHPSGSSFVCIEPMSATNPRKPCLTVSTLEVTLRIIT